MCAKYWVSGNPYPKTAYFYTEGCNLPMKTRIDAILKDTVYRFAVPDTLFKIDSVLNATATSYSDAWINDYQDARFTSNHVSIINNLHKMEGFWTGERGVWKPMESYVYVDDRDQTPSVDLREDGAFNEVPMFNFQSLVMLGCAEKWKKVNEITRVNPYGYETENRDILGVYSTALYGFGGRLPVAVAANSAYHEVAFESFEEYDNNETIDQFEMTTGNLDLYNYKQPASTSPFRVFEFYDVFFGSKDTASTTEGNSQFWTYTKDSVKFAARCHGHSNRIATHAADMAKRFASYRDLASRSNNGGFEEYKISDAPVFHLKPDTVVWKGRMGVPQDVNLINSGYNIFFSSARAHTGTKSMKVVGKTTFPQNRFRPTENEEYLFSAWVSQDSSLVPTFKGSSLANANRLGIEVHFIDSAGNTISSTGLIEPSGHPVEGWQKIEGSFTIPDSTVRVELTLQPNVVGGSAVNAYFDDIRFMPADAAMKTYVYDPDNYRLKAILDDNNYATIYRYDDQGNLFLVMKETARGIKTIQESRSHLRELLAP